MKQIADVERIVRHPRRTALPQSTLPYDVAVPLIVDLDGTLIAGDTLWECAFRLLATRPFMVLLIPFWLLKGRSHLKAQVAKAITLDPEALSYREDVLAFLRREKSKGRSLLLVTAADERIAVAIAGHLGLFDKVLASDGRRNLKGAEKLALIRQTVGGNEFDYIGDSRADIVIWQAAGRAIIVGDHKLVGSAEKQGVPLLESFPVAHASFKQWRQALRLHQWVKNTLIFVPLILSHQVTNIEKMTAAVIAFVAFGLCASATYIWNDLLDLPSDRRHPTKRKRPLASGQIAIVDGVWVSLLLMIASIATSAVFLSIKFVGVLADYRRYFMPARPFTLAFRALHYGRYGSGGEDQRISPLFIGYPNLVRGYDVNSFDARECGIDPNSDCPVFDQLLGSKILVGNAELRFPPFGAITGSRRNLYGPLPLELVFFGDTGVAWTEAQNPEFLSDGTRKFVSSVGAGARVNLFGYAVVEVDYVKPLDRDKGWHWVFNFSPGF